MSIPSRYRKPYQHKSQVPLDPASNSDTRFQAAGMAAGMQSAAKMRDFENTRSAASSPVYSNNTVPPFYQFNQSYQQPVLNPQYSDYNRFRAYPAESASNNTMHGSNIASARQYAAPHNPHEIGSYMQPQQPNSDNINKLLRATKGATKGAIPTSDATSPQKVPNIRNKTSRYNMTSVSEFKAPIMLPNRLVYKTLDNTDTAASVLTRLISEHRLEFDSEALVLWEEIASTFRRPVREQERIYEIVKRWPSHAPIQFTVTSDALRYDERSLASLAPRRDMLRQLPSILGAEVQFSVPSSEYELTWGKGDISIVDKMLILRQSYDSHKIVCRCSAENLDVYEIVDKSKARKCPLKYTLAFKQQIEGGIIVISTDSAKLTSELRNAIFTSRTRFLQLNKAA